MQTLTEIREILAKADLTPRRQFGQNFLIDHNLMRKLLDLAEVEPNLPVLEVGPGTGSLTEELVRLAAKVVAVEIDRGLADLLAQRLAMPRFQLIRGDVLADKRHLSPEVLAALGPEAQLVANLPYNIATPLIAQCLQDGWHGGRCLPPCSDERCGNMAANDGRHATQLTLFRRLTFTVQREVADRLVAGPGSDVYGPVSVIVTLLSRAKVGAVLPGSAFWPRPNVESRMLRLDFDARRAGEVRSIDTLNEVLTLSFGQRRKQLGSIFRKSAGLLPPDALATAARDAGIDLASRAEEIPPEQFLHMANALAGPGKLEA